MHGIITKKLELASDFNAAAASFKADPRVEENANCYAYALGLTDHGYAAPGKLLELPNSPQKLFTAEELTVENIDKLLTENDGLIKIDPQDLDRMIDKVTIIAAFISPHDDVHFYRSHGDKTWSNHKGDVGGVSNRDCKGDLLTDPRRARRGRYTDLVGFYHAPKQGVSYMKHP
jgi:hypothetical protein